ncbi:hypothetical protein BDZ45DRAFT_788320 [Acephala macrosclerotiorum]|nr:hypothetical protein BDZ45DRAFT_788320 [Acephala macrosclerotiorum]
MPPSPVDAELESPPISALQCHILSVVYLCNASFQNMAHTTLAVAIRTAHILGLHLEPPENMPRAQSESRKRIWWTLYAIESKTCLKLGRPIHLLADDHELAATSEPGFAPVDQNVTWLTCGLQLVKLILAAQATYAAWYDKFADTLTENPGQARKDGSKPCLTQRSPLEASLFAPLWLKRQRIYLEILYCNLTMDLYRPFISFPSSSHTSTLPVEHNSISCVKHAIPITTMMHQILHETDIIHGWHEAFQWQ